MGYAVPLTLVISISALLGLLCWSISGYNIAMSYVIANVVPLAKAASEFDLYTYTLTDTP